MANEPAVRHLTLSENRVVGKDCHALIFDGDVGIIPGQFMMLWKPDSEEIPMSISHSWSGKVGFTVKVVGEATDALCSLKKGDRIRARGPFGRGFQPKGKKWILVAGGVGAAPLLPLASTFQSGRMTVILGAKTKEEIVLEDDFRQARADVLISTDDGSSGFRGTASELFAKTLSEKGTCDSVYCCGPEPMIASVAKAAEERGIWGQAALERHMKCGIGVCGSCAISEKLVCRDGPVFDLSVLTAIADFAKTKRDASGRARTLIR